MSGELLLGTAADDHVRGFGGDDLLRGAGVGDRLRGGAGDDVLHGGKDGDLLRGGPGADRFVFGAPMHSDPDAARDLILDFSRAEGDRIGLRALDGDPDRAGDQRLEFVGEDAFTGAGQVRYTLAGGHTTVEVSLNADAGAELAFRLDRDLILVERDFLL